MHPPVVKNMVFCDFCHVQFSITCGLSPDLNDITGIKHMGPNQAFGKLYGIDMGTLLAFLGNLIVVQIGPGDYTGQLFMGLFIVDIRCHSLS